MQMHSYLDVVPLCLIRYTLTNRAAGLLRQAQSCLYTACISTSLVCIRIELKVKPSIFDAGNLLGPFASLVSMFS